MQLPHGGLGTLGAREAVGDLVGLLSYPSAEVRLAALDALERLAARDAASAISRCLGDADRQVRIGARTVLMSLGAVEELKTDTRLPWLLRQPLLWRARRNRRRAKTR